MKFQGTHQRSDLINFSGTLLGTDGDRAQKHIYKAV